MLTRRRLCAHLFGLPLAFLLPTKSETSTLEIKKTAINTLEVKTGDALVALTIAEPLKFKGTYRVDPRQLERGPVNVVPPDIAVGKSNRGPRIQLVPGLWIHHVDTHPTRSWQWLCNGAVIGRSAFIENVDDNTELMVVETLEDRFGAQSKSSQRQAIVAHNFLA